MTNLGFLVLCGALAAAAATRDASGHWEGQIQLPQRELGITVDLSKDAQGKWVGSMTLVGASAADVPLAGLAVHDGGIKFAAYLPDYASFEGSLSEDRDNLSGKASNAQGDVPFRLVRKGEAQVNVPPPNSALPNSFSGVWEGLLNSGGKNKRVRLNLASGADGLATALLTSVDDGNQEIPVTTVTIRDRQLRVEARAVSGVFQGTLGGEDEISGEWSEGSLHRPLTFKRAARP